MVIGITTTKLDLYDNAVLVGNDLVIILVSGLSDATIYDLSYDLDASDNKVFMDGRYFEVTEFGIEKTLDGQYEIQLKVQEENKKWQRITTR